MLPKCKFIKRFCSDSRPSKFKTHPGSGDDFFDQLNYLPHISETVFELPSVVRFGAQVDISCLVPSTSHY